MPSLHLRSVTFAYSSAVTVLDDVDLDLGAGWYGVVGANGAGKTTLLRLVAGELSPARGQVDVLSDLAPVLCHQEVGAVTPDVEALASRWDGDAARLRSILGLDPPQLERWTSLSPGERKRWQVGAALSSEPDVLLLDEPTNHLDAEARGMLVEALRRFQGIGLVVSHDRALLDDLTDRTLRLVAGRVELWAGGYTDARERWSEHERGVQARHEQLRAEQRRLRRQLADARRDRASAERTSAAERRRAGPRNPDARSMEKKGRAARAEQSLAQQVAARHSRVERVTAEIGEIDLRSSLGGPVSIAHARHGGRWLAEVDADVLHAGRHPVLRDVHVGVAESDRIHVAGANGAGKTTLLNAVLEAARLPADRVAHLPQELADEEVARLLRDTRGLDRRERGRVLGVVALLGVEPDRLLATDRPSPGEARKLALALALGREVALVALDEPTNHLDLPSIERLEDALAGYGGALLLVTHDQRLADRVTSTVWEVAGGSVRIRLRRAPSS